MTDGNTIRSVAKAMELLQLLSDAGEAMTLTAISERAGLPKSTVFGLLTTMRDYDVVTQHADGKYALGLRLFEYGCRASAFWNISSLARPYLEHLAEATGASAMLSTYENGHIVALDQAEGRDSLRIVSAPVFTGGGALKYVVSVLGMFRSVHSDEFAHAERAVVAAGQMLSAALGYPGK